MCMEISVTKTLQKYYLMLHWNLVTAKVLNKLVYKETVWTSQLFLLLKPFILRPLCNWRHRKISSINLARLNFEHETTLFSQSDNTKLSYRIVSHYWYRFYVCNRISNTIKIVSLIALNTEENLDLKFCII